MLRFLSYLMFLKRILVILYFKPQRRAKNVKIDAQVTELSNKVCLVPLFIGFFDGFINGLDVQSIFSDTCYLTSNRTFYEY